MIAPFDAVADRYDADWTESPAGRAERAALWRHLDRIPLAPGGRVLDLGCGTGVDAIRFARRGARVVAIDASAAMLERARAAADRAGVAVDFRAGRLEELEALLAEEAPFDLALSSFSPFDCVAELAPPARALARLVRPGGRLAITIFGRLCPTEIAGSLLRLDFERALRRLRPRSEARVGDGRIEIHYRWPRELARAFAPAFRLRRLRGVGLLVAPAAGATTARLAAVLERPFLALLARFADHVVVDLERVDR